MVNRPLTIRNLWVRYKPEKWILKNVNLEVNKSEVLILIGRNGSGKTTLLKVILGLIKPQEGEILIYGKNLKNVMPLLPSILGYSPQYPLHHFNFNTVMEELEMTLKLKGCEKPRKRAAEILQELDIGNLRNRSPYTLSSGEQRLLSIALAISHDPDLILLDEPFSGLDLLEIRRIVEIINGLKKNSKSIILTSTLNLFYIGANLDAKVMVLDATHEIYKDRGGN